MTNHIGDINEMVFSDKDLKQLKEDLRKLSPDSTDCFHIETINSIIARLEAADECAKNLWNLHPDMQCVKAWRKAAGK